MLRRVRQFRDASIAPSIDDFALAREWLSLPLLALFERQHPRDVVHTANTARWLLARGHRDSNLIAAALLHDAGKGQQRRRDRVAVVVAQWVRLQRIAASPSSRIEMRRAAYRSIVHSAVGADHLRTAGAPGHVVELVRKHHAKAGDDGMLALLQQADAAS
jgi:putative nucleotidyltransferase with HDIG domain